MFRLEREAHSAAGEALRVVTSVWSWDARLPSFLLDNIVLISDIPPGARGFAATACLAD